MTSKTFMLRHVKAPIIVKTDVYCVYSEDGSESM